MTDWKKACNQRDRSACVRKGIRRITRKKEPTTLRLSNGERRDVSQLLKKGRAKSLRGGGETEKEKA